ncbi:hypothetical protein A8709_14545 [Paenibacillus pectinilyticus]|uniref:BIG2 domain-containing protein n=1 Tax=Paenibacillus pectinilyticus TaxID=512399 RepID=A0A1C1A424_9BACL|nr:Ig-like domain-containing protein [Paenibacillus pectinilyticus]OCT15311.1 hypothetical protein A8709_14545 [Paenibacillus pectinilyticus]
MDSMPQLSFSNNRYRKSLRRTGLLALTLMLILNLYAAFYIQFADAATSQIIVMDKTQYLQSEPVTLSYKGAAANGKDWVGIYKTGDTPPGSGVAITWNYAKSGDGKVSFSGLAPGTYDALFLFNDGYTILDRKTFQVVTSMPVSGVTLDQPKIRMTQGDIQTLTATVSPGNANDQRVSWISSNPSIVSVTATGGIATLNANLPGTATVTSTTYDGNFKASATVRVDPPGYIRVSGISIDKQDVTLEKGQTTQVTATVAPVDAANPNVLWTSSNPSVASVVADVNGTATIQANSGGIASITATAADDEGYTVVSNITVHVPANGVLLDQANIQMVANQSVQLHATVSPADALNKNVIWSSSDPSIVQVTGLNDTTDATILGLKVGTAVITVRTVDGNFTQDCNVTVAVLDNTALKSAITAAQVKLDSASIGSKWGQYSQSAAGTLHAAISAANVVWSNVNATQTEVNQSVIALNSALQNFEGALNVNASIGDVAIISAHNGSTSVSSDWADIQRYDLNQDNEISIIDLQAMAKMIVNQ